MNIALSDKTAQMLETYRLAKKLSPEQALEQLLFEATEKNAFEQILHQHWQTQTSSDDDFDQLVTQAVRQDRSQN